MQSEVSRYYLKDETDLHFGSIFLCIHFTQILHKYPRFNNKRNGIGIS